MARSTFFVREVCTSKKAALEPTGKIVGCLEVCVQLQVLPVLKSTPATIY